MLIGEIGNSGAIPALEASLRFAGTRQQLIAHNIANIETPDFRPRDVDPRAFQRVLGAAVDERRKRTSNEHGPLRMKSGREVEVGPDGTLDLRPGTPSGNILFHDRNDRDLERLMQDNAENVSAYRITAELLRGRFELLKSAISERA